MVAEDETQETVWMVKHVDENAVHLEGDDGWWFARLETGLQRERSTFTACWGDRI